MKKQSNLRENVVNVVITVSAVLGFVLIVFLMLFVRGWAGEGNMHHRGDYPDLFTVAINSLLGSRGYETYSVPLPAQIRVIEADEHGRVLFLYSERNNISTYSLLISQKSDGEYVYFYPHHNFISTACMSCGSLRPFSQRNPVELIMSEFPAEEIEELKERNSWNQELNLDYAIRVPITRTKEDRDGPVDNETLLSTYLEVSGLEERWRRSPFEFFITDAYDRSIYVSRTFMCDCDTCNFPYRGWQVFVVLFQPDGSFDIDTGFIELHDLQRYQDELKAFKEQNGWNQPWP